MSLYTMKRGWMEHPLFEGEPYSRAQAWEWMVSEAAWRETRKFIGGKMVALSRGQFSHSIRFMAEKWRWDRSKVERFVKALKTETMIGTENETGQLKITICNYKSYQLNPKENETAVETEIETPSRQQRDKEEEGNKVISSEGKPSSPRAHIREASPKISLEQLSVDHIAAWLAEKRIQGRYIHHDEHFILEHFRNYCQSKGKKYADFIAAYRNAFEWESCQPKHVGANRPPTKDERARAAVIRGLGLAPASAGGC